MVLADALIFTDQTLDLWNLLLPFVLVFTIVFAILQKINLFGGTGADGKQTKTKQFNVVIALVMGMAVVLPHIYGLYPPDGDIVNIINSALPNVSIVLIAIVMALIVIGVFGKRLEIGGNSASGWVAILAFVLIIYIFGSAANWWHLPDWLYFLNDPQTMTLVIVILVFAIIIWFITKEDKEMDAAQREAAMKNSIPYQVSTWLK